MSRVGAGGAVGRERGAGRQLLCLLPIDSLFQIIPETCGRWKLSKYQYGRGHMGCEENVMCVCARKQTLDREGPIVALAYWTKM